MNIAGALEDQTGKYILPKFASKNNNYTCVDCGARVIFRKGEVRIPHFAHFTRSNCEYFEHPSESQIHKDAKWRLAEMLKEGKTVTISWECDSVRCQGAGHDSIEFTCSNDDQVFVEYRGPGGVWIADVAVVNNNKVKCIFEIFHTHKTTTQRPEPWYEIKASDISLDLFCERRRPCFGCETLKQPWMDNAPRIKRLNARTTPCILCNRLFYSAIFINGFRSVCKLCLDRRDELRNLLEIKGRKFLMED